MKTCQYFIQQLEDGVCNLFGFPRLAAFHDLAGRLHQLEVELADKLRESSFQVRLALEEII